MTAGGGRSASPPPAVNRYSPSPEGDQVGSDDAGGTAWERRPTGTVGGSPTGRRTRIDPDQLEVARRSLELENEGADLLAGKGYRVHQNPTSSEIAEARARTGDAGDPNKDPDYLIEGHVFDCYSPRQATSVRAIWTAVERKTKRGQSQRVVVNLRDWQGDLAALRQQFADWPISGLKELAVITPAGSTVQTVPSRSRTGKD